MINANGDKQIGINVNNYCFTPGQPSESIKQSKVVLNDSVSSERERLINYIKAHIKKYN
jgi:hypothetical protein